MIPCMERYGTKSKNSKFSKFQIFVLLACHFPENNWVWFDLNWKTENDTINPENWSASKLLGIRTWVFSFCKLCLQFGTEPDIFWFDIGFFSDLVPVVLSVILDIILMVLPVILDVFRYVQMSLQWFPSFSIWFNPISCLQLYNSMQFHAWNHMIPYDSMHGTIWFHAIPRMETAWNYRMEPYGHHMVPYDNFMPFPWNRMGDLWIWIREKLSCSIISILSVTETFNNSSL